MARRSPPRAAYRRAALASGLPRHKETPSLAELPPATPPRLHPAAHKNTNLRPRTRGCRADPLEARRGSGRECGREKSREKRPNLRCGLVDEMRMVEEVVMMEREVVVGG